MSKILKVIKEINLDGTENGCIRIGIIDEPYGKGSNSVASIAISLEKSSSEPNWKVHIPKENIDDIIDALKEIKGQI